MKPISNLTDEELLDRYYDLVYGAVDNRSRDARLVRTELLRRRKLTLEWMATHLEEVARIAEKGVKQ